jgi:CRP-like cAMP-binding protein
MAAIEKPDFREFARALGTVVSYGPGDMVFRENDTLRAMYIVLSGSVTISSRDTKIESIPPGESFGILALVDGQPTPIAARADEPSEVALIDQKKFRYMVEEVPNFVWYVVGELAHRLRTTNAKL